MATKPMSSSYYTNNNTSSYQNNNNNNLNTTLPFKPSAGCFNRETGNNSSMPNGAGKGVALTNGAIQHHLAPLASLDCSITEPIHTSSSSNQNSCDNSPLKTGSSMQSMKRKNKNIASQECTRQPSVETNNTLSGYFDCDQFSDMIDDSLIEITEFGCIPSQTNHIYNNKSIIMDPEICEEIDQFIQLKAHSKSSSSSKDRNIASSTLNQLDKSKESKLQNSKSSSIQQDRSKIATSVPKSKSNNEFPVLTMDSANPYQNLSRTHQLSVSEGEISAKRAPQKTRKGIKKLTYDIYNFFFPHQKLDPDLVKAKSSEAFESQQIKSPTQSQIQKTDSRRLRRQQQQHNQNNSTNPKKTIAAKEAHDKSIPADESGVERHSRLNLRDSIKVTNQRKRRNLNNNVARNLNDSSKINRAGSSSKSTKSNRGQAAAQPNGNKSNKQQATNGSTTKSVKFSMPSKSDFDVNNGKLNGSQPAIMKRAHKHQSNLQPVAPIIKPVSKYDKPVSSVSEKNQPKPIIPIANCNIIEIPIGESIEEVETDEPNEPETVARINSSSQTDNDEQLNDILNQFDQNDQLIAEISRKLSLNETIASPRSILDRSISQDDSTKTPERVDNNKTA